MASEAALSATHPPPVDTAHTHTEEHIHTTGAHLFNIQIVLEY